MEIHGDTIDDIHSLTMEVGLPASLEDMKNPTEDFIVNIIAEFFRAFFIDVDQIRQLTPEQLNALEVTNPENATIAPLFNLREVMGVIGRGIFIKDFQITDITSPRQVRTKKHLKFIVNFILYARNKKQHMQDKIDEVLSEVEKLQNLHKQHQEMVEKMNTQAMVTAQKASQIEKLKLEVVENEAALTENKEKIMEKDKVLQEKLQIKAEKIARDNAQRAKLQKLRERIEESRAKVVKSPEKIRIQLTELEEARKEQEEKRETFQAAILQKKKLLQVTESALTIMKRGHGGLKEIIKEQKKLQIMLKDCDRIREEIDGTVRNINLAEKLGSQDHHQAGIDAIEECEKQCHERKNKLLKTCAEFDSEKKMLERKKQKIETRCTEFYSETLQIREKIAEVEGDIASFLQQCQGLYDSDIDKLHNLKAIFVS